MGGSKFMKEKRGQMHYEYIVAMILGIMVLSLALYFIFIEYFNEEGFDLEVCRQSILLRANLPDVEVVGFTLTSFKDKYPLKCKTQVLNIDYEDRGLAEREIANAIAASWNLMGKGQNYIFPSVKEWGRQVPCLIFYRIHIDEDVREFYDSNNQINLQGALHLKFGDSNYLDYLNPEDGPHAFNYFKGWGEEFNFTKIMASVYDDGKTVYVLDPKNPDYRVFYFPEKIDPLRDFFIIYAEPNHYNSDSESGRAIYPYFILTQDLGVLDSIWIGYGGNVFKGDLFPNLQQICSSVETIPA